MNLKSMQFCSTVLLTFTLVLQFNFLLGQSNEDCFMCHEDPGLKSEVDGRSMFVDKRIIKNSVHEGVECASCHKDAAAEGFPHKMDLAEVNCGDCHKNANSDFFKGTHGQALSLNERYAPTCKECHGEHTILAPTNPKSNTYKMNIPKLCGKCHKEGAPVAREYNISEHNILENYSQSIHGKGLFKSGLIVTATCNDCHGNHLVLPHTSPNSSISSKNIAKTCMKCHARIEDVHTKVIKGELWEKSPGAIPACTDCHPPHKVDPENVAATMSDNSCLKCHGKDDIYKTVDGEKISLTVDKNEIQRSEHKNITCVKCHSDVTPHLERPCETVVDVNCDNCHNEISTNYFASGHGKAYFKKDEDAPYCTDCHGSHFVQSRYDDTSPTYKTAIPDLCGKCHQKDNKAIMGKGLKQVDAFADYSSSVHGRGVEEKGLTVSAVCTDCHTTHFILKESDPSSSVNPKNIPKTCANCHKGIYDDYIASDHDITHSVEGEKDYPTCTKCHSSHTITEIEDDAFMSEINHQCGSCHEKLTKTYMETYHGKAYSLGYEASAKCSDCHGAHKILNVRNPESMVSKENILTTCMKCHPDANERFTGFLTHATHDNRDEYPVLYYTFWGMTFLLIGVFAFFGIHTLLWLPRSLKERKKRKHLHHPKGKAVYIRRFKTRHRVTHIFVIISFVILALTGMMLKFANMEWAKTLSDLIGGVKAAGNWHRFAAVITFGYFIFHLTMIISAKFKKKIKVKDFMFSGSSLMFNRQDLRDFVATIKWFIGKGPKPEYGRWTYWEKFDYMAVFWGVAVIGLSGLVLWFPEVFTKFLPGWLINVAMIIHSDEALLAVGFIFTIHFFNTHFRPEAFPMDTVIFTGHLPEEIYKEDRPKEYEELVRTGKIDEVKVEKEFSKTRMRVIKIFGFIALSIGLILTLLIIYSLLFGTH